MIHSYEDPRKGQTPFLYWHARIVGIYHLVIQTRDGSTTTLSDEIHIDVLFVRWFEICFTDYESGWRAQRLHKLRFLPDNNLQGHAFGFADPNEVIRMVHIIPDFSSVRTKELWVRPSVAAQDAHPDGEYPVYYIAM